MKNVLNEFYTALNNKDAEKMVALYHDNIEFEDPAFGFLKGERAKNMWRMLCENGKDLTVKHRIIDINKSIGKVNWKADYTFGQTGKKVHNEITANFEFKDGLIIKHKDEFNLYYWAKQALGFKGLILGNTKFFKKKLQFQTNKSLSKFEIKRNGK